MRDAFVMKNKKLLPLGLIVGLIACAIPGAVKMDSVMAQIQMRDTVTAGDTSLIVSGCGAQPISGFTYCRVTEGAQTASLPITIHLPSVQCMPVDRGGPATCITLYALAPNGHEVSWDVPRNSTTLTKTLAELLGTATFQRFDRGLINLLAEVRWLDPEGNIRVSFAEGEIRVRVLAGDYEAARTRSFSDNVVWRWQAENTQMEMTAALRSKATPLNTGVVIPRPLPSAVNPQTLAH